MTNKPEVSSDREIMEMVLDALEYHVEQTRPIQRTANAIEALRARLASPVELVHAAPYNHWREFIENVISGDNYFRHREYEELLDYIDSLLVAKQSPSAAQSGEKEL